jgi:RHS repeat-associated protein
MSLALAERAPAPRLQPPALAADLPLGESPLGPAVLAGDPREAACGSADPPGASKYYRARYYDPHLGRFISEDPIGFAGGANLYAYVENNPALFSDPLGFAVYQPTAPAPPTGSTSILSWFAYDLRQRAYEAQLNKTGTDAALDAMGMAAPLGMAARGGKSAAELAKHLGDVASFEAELKGLKEALERATGPKTRKPIEEAIEKVLKDIKGHYKEMRQKWPDACPKE